MNGSNGGMIQYKVHRNGADVAIFNADTFALSDGWFVFFRQAFTKEFGVVSNATYAFAQKDVERIEAAFPEQPKPKLDLITN